MSYLKSVVVVVPAGEIYQMVDDAVKHSPAWCILFGGDRIACCDEAVILKQAVTGNLIGIATIAPHGEDGNGPSIVGLWINPRFRKCGYSTVLLKNAIDRCRERGFKTVNMDVLSSYLMRTIKNSQPEDLSNLFVRDLGGSFDLFA